MGAQTGAGLTVGTAAAAPTPVTFASPCTSTANLSGDAVVGSTIVATDPAGIDVTNNCGFDITVGDPNGAPVSILDGATATVAVPYVGQLEFIDTTGPTTLFSMNAFTQLTINDGGGLAADGSDGIAMIINYHSVSNPNYGFISGGSPGGEQVITRSEASYYDSNEVGGDVQSSIYVGAPGAGGVYGTGASWNATDWTSQELVSVDLDGAEQSIVIDYTADVGGSPYVMRRDISYTFPNLYVTETYTFTVPGTPEPVRFYTGGDTSPGGSDTGYAIVEPAAGDPVTPGGQRVIASVNPDPSVGQQLIFRTVPTTDPNYKDFDGWWSGDYNDKYSQVQNGDPLGQTFDPSPDHDAGITVQWDIPQVAGTYTYALEKAVTGYATVTMTPNPGSINAFQTSTLEYTLINTNPTAITSESLAITMPAEVKIAAGASTDCSGTLTAAADDTTASLAGFSLAGQVGSTIDSCTVSIPVMSVTNPGAPVTATFADTSVVPSTSDVLSLVSASLSISPGVLAVPGAPLNVVGVAGTESVSVTWDAPISDGGSAILDYTVEWSSDGGANWNGLVAIGSDSRAYTVTGLSSSSAYVFRVSAENAQGLGTPSVVSASVTPNAPAPPAPPPAPVYPPSAPSGVAAIAGNQSATVSWSAPASEGSFPVSQYQVSATPGGAGCLVPAGTLTCTVTGLTNGTTYTFTVRALNGAGWSAYSSASNGVTPDADPTPAPPTPPAPQPVPTPVPPGGSSAQENGVDIPVDVNPNPAANGLVVSGEDFSMSIEGLNAQGRPLNLGPDGVLVLQQDRNVSTQGSGFLPDSSVGLFLYPDPAVSGAVARASQDAVDLGTVAVDGSGDFTGAVTLPDSVTPGDYVVQAVGTSERSTVRVVNLGVRVEADRSILITGTRTTINGKSGVRVTATSTGLAGEYAVPRIKFAGQESYSRGKGVRLIEADGTFTWKRIAKKKIYVYFLADGVRSNRIILSK